jgi:hypothetical protein
MNKIKIILSAAIFILLVFKSSGTIFAQEMPTIIAYVDTDDFNMTHYDSIFLYGDSLYFRSALEYASLGIMWTEIGCYKNEDSSLVLNPISPTVPGTIIKVINQGDSVDTVRYIYFYDSRGIKCNMFFSTQRDGVYSLADHAVIPVTEDSLFLHQEDPNDEETRTFIKKRFGDDNYELPPTTAYCLNSMNMDKTFFYLYKIELNKIQKVVNTRPTILLKKNTRYVKTELCISDSGVRYTKTKQYTIFGNK